MQSNIQTTLVALTLLVILALWLVAPALAGSGDPVQAKQAWPMIEKMYAQKENSTQVILTVHSISPGMIPLPWWMPSVTTLSVRWWSIAVAVTAPEKPR